MLGSRILGKTGRVGKYTVLDENNRCYELTYFGEQEQLLSYWEKKGKINVTYYAEQNTYRGRTQIQFIVQSFQ